MPGKADEAYKSVYVRYTLTAANRTNGTFNGVAVDTAEKGGSDSVLAFCRASTITDGTHTFTTEESADGATGWTAIPAGRIHGTQPALTSAQSNQFFEWGAAPALRFVRAVQTVTGATSGGSIFSVIAVSDSKFEAH